METTARLAMPLIEPGQAQKELFHNEALMLIDAGVQASVAAAGVNVPPASPPPGRCWIVGPAATGAWSGRARAIACATAGGWRFLIPGEGWTVWDVERRQVLRHVDGEWETGIVPARRIVIDGTPVLGPRQSAIAAPTGGNIVDIEARQVVAAMLAMLRTHGLIAP